MTDDGDKPDPFAPLPLAPLPPVRSKDPAPSLDQAWEAEPVPVEQIASEPVEQQAWSEAPAPAVIPAAYSDDELRDAVGVTPLAEPSRNKKRKDRPRAADDDDDDGEPRKRNRRTMLVAAASIFVGGGIAALVLLGKVNSAHYFISCEAERVVVEQGRSFPPWGASELGGPEWKSLKIPPEGSCHEFETEDRADLAREYEKILVAQATKQLTAREVTKVDEAEGALKQALLVSRLLRTDDDTKNARGDIDRLLGDVEYWRASARLKSAADTLVEAAKQFEAASAQRPAHSTDAAEWAGFAHRVADQLRAGPAGMPPTAFPPVPPGERPMAPAGTALPVEPDQGSAAVEPTPAPDAGVPTGGVLL